MAHVYCIPLSPPLQQGAPAHLGPWWHHNITDWSPCWHQYSIPPAWHLVGTDEKVEESHLR